jgi:multidrug resistance efflux pump
MQIRQADPAERLQLEIQAAKHTLRSPLTGMITRVPLKVGETVVPGQTVVVVSNPSQLEVNLYVREADLGQVFLSQAVSISADPYPDRTFDGTVTWINPRAEFTPRNVQTRQDRQNLVFAVKVRIANPDEALRPGLPVDATFAPGRPAR